ncbi:MAG TPA: hypothetical protein VMJ75_30780 [Candidatus Acidoferrales bacterium]|nr:hypothetical protein [Candidatus Acidoferrales bacterium]
MYRSLLLTATLAAASAQPVRLTVNTPIVTRIIDEKLYGQSVDAGIWGEAVRNPRFVEMRAEGSWRVHEGVLECPSPGGRLRLNGQRDFDLTFEMRRTEDAGTLVIGTFVFSPETNGWQRAHLRVSGTRADVWIDDMPLTPLSPSDVNLGARGGAAQFRSFKFTSLDGHQLYSALPLPQRNWYAAGPIEAAPGENGLRVATGDTDAIAAIEQHGVAVRAGDPLRGELRASGSLQGVTVRLLDGAKVIASSTGHPLTLAPITSVPDATLQILLPRHCDITLQQIGLTYDSTRASGGYHPDLVQALAALRPPMLRWSAENWKTASFGVDQFLALAQKLGSTPVIAIPPGWIGPDVDEFIHRYESRVKYFDRGGYASEWEADSPLAAAVALIDLERDSRLPMAAPVLATVIDFDRHPWEQTPVYTVIQLFREHFGTDVLQMTGDSGSLSAIATRTQDGRKIYVKLVNRRSTAADLELSLRGDFPMLAADLKIAGADSTRVTPAGIERSGLTVRFRLPALCAGVVTLTR